MNDHASKKLLLRKLFLDFHHSNQAYFLAGIASSISFLLSMICGQKLVNCNSICNFLFANNCLSIELITKSSSVTGVIAHMYLYLVKVNLVLKAQIIFDELQHLLLLFQQLHTASGGSQPDVWVGGFPCNFRRQVLELHSFRRQVSELHSFRRQVLVLHSFR